MKKSKIKNINNLGTQKLLKIQNIPNLDEYNILLQNKKQSDKNYLIDSSALSSLLQDDLSFIPLSGTVEGSPVTGDIRFGDSMWSYNGYKIYSNNINDDNSVEVYNAVNFGIDDLNNGLTLYSEDKTNSKISFIRINGESMELSTDGNSIPISTGTENSVGLSGVDNYSANITDLDYTQKIYVDQAIDAISPYKEFSGELTGDAVAHTFTQWKNTINLLSVPAISRVSEGVYKVWTSTPIVDGVSDFPIGYRSLDGHGCRVSVDSGVIVCPKLLTEVDNQFTFQVYTLAGILTDDFKITISVKTYPTPPVDEGG